MKNALKFLKIAACALLASVAAKAIVLPGVNQPITTPFANGTLTTITYPSTAQGYNPLGFLLRGDGNFVFGSDLAATFSSGGVGAFVNNSTAPASAQAPVAATRTYIGGTQLVIPAIGLQVGTVLRWHFDITKTAAGTAASTFDIAVGTAGTTADTAVVSFTKPAGTAAADEGFIDIEAVVRSIGAGTAGVMVGEFRMVHNLAATGHATIPCVVVNTVSSGFAITPAAASSVGICITTGASDAITINQVSAEVINP
jgi:hypothetical protein